MLVFNAKRKEYKHSLIIHIHWTNLALAHFYKHQNFEGHNNIYIPSAWNWSWSQGLNLADVNWRLKVVNNTYALKVAPYESVLWSKNI